MSGPIHTGAALRIESQADLARAIGKMRQANLFHRVELMEALAAGLIAHDEIARDTPARRIKQFVALVRKPAVILVGDDDHAPTGPQGWPQARRLMQWAAHIVVHASVGRAEEYRAAVATAQAARRVLLIETSSDHAVLWIGAAGLWAPRTFLHVIVPPPGQAWPGSPRKEAMH